MSPTTLVPAKLGRMMLLWESLMAGMTALVSGLGLAAVIPGKYVGLAVIMLQALNAFTIAYKQGLQTDAVASKKPEG